MCLAAALFVVLVLAGRLGDLSSAVLEHSTLSNGMSALSKIAARSHVTARQS